MKPDGTRFVIFDVDGTLVDSVDLYARSWKEIFAAFGKDIPFESVRSQIGQGPEQVLPMFFSTQEIDEYGTEMEDARSRLFRSRYLPLVRPFPKVRELFERIRSEGTKIALASSADRQNLENYERIAGIENLVARGTPDNASQSKPHPDVFQAALDSLGRPDSAQVIVVGDAPHDARAAHKLDLETVGMLCGGFLEKDLRAAGCIAIYRDPEDLLDHYDASPLDLPLPLHSHARRSMSLQEQRARTAILTKDL